MSKAEYMKRDEMVDIPGFCVEYLVYLQVIRALSPLTVREYYLDLKTFFRYLKQKKKIGGFGYIVSVKIHRA